MDTISFVKTTVTGPCNNYTAAKIIINGEDFKQDIEKLHILTYNYQYADWLYKRLSDPQEKIDDHFHPDVAIFTCLCTVDECGGFYCKVTTTDDKVIWSDFHTSSRTNHYESMSPLRFDKSAYMVTLEHLKTFTQEDEQ